MESSRRFFKGKKKKQRNDFILIPENLVSVRVCVRVTGGRQSEEDRKRKGLKQKERKTKRHRERRKEREREKHIQKKPWKKRVRNREKK